MEPETEREKGEREGEGSQRDIGAIDGERRGRGKEKAVREILEP